MMADKTSVLNPLGICKLAILVLGLVSLGVGLHSHFQSSWVKPVSIPSTTIRVIKPYKLCESKHLQMLIPAFRDKSCPHISMEQYFISIIIICFLLSVADFVAGFLLDLRSKPLMWIDLGFHCVSAVLLLIAAIVYIVSAMQIDNIVSQMVLVGVNFRKSEKLAAAAITIIQSLLYSAVALLIVKT